MEYVRLGQSELIVSRLSFGCEQLGGVDWGGVDTAEVCRAVRIALEKGVNLFDTADVYGLGRSEELLGTALGPARHDVVIATKFGISWTDAGPSGRARTFRDCTAKRAVQALEGSLRRLKVDCIPLYQIHWPDPNVPMHETMEALIRCQQEGKLRHIGCCNFSSEQLEAAFSSGAITSLQSEHSILSPLTDGRLHECCEKNGIGVLAYGVLALGLLSGKYEEGTIFPDNDRRSRLDGFAGQLLAERLTVVHRVRKMAQRLGKSPAQIAIRWVLDTPNVSVAVAGIKTVGQLEENLGALDWRLLQEDYESLRQPWAGAQSGRSPMLG